MSDSFIRRVIFYLPTKFYQLIVRLRIELYRRGIFRTYKLKAPVISVGNLSVGGTGKTPCVAFLAQFLRDEFLRGEGYSVAILSRGYRRQSSGLVEVSNGQEILATPEIAGDEPSLLAKNCPGVRVIVDADRYRGGAWLEAHAPVSVFILDDGYQHLKLARQINLLLIDARVRLDQTALLPLGRWREPLSEMRRADAIIVTRSDHDFSRAALEQKISQFSGKQIPVFYAFHQITSLQSIDQREKIDPVAFRERRVAVISAVGRPERFNKDLLFWGMQIVFRRDFPDHYRYRRPEFLEVSRQALEAGAEAIMITEKDAANLPAGLESQSALPLFTAHLEFRCEREDALKEFLLKNMEVFHAEVH